MQIPCFFKIVLRIPEIWVHKVELWSVLEARGFVKRPSHDLMSQAIASEFKPWTLALSFEKNSTVKCFSFSTNGYSFEESIRALHSIPSGAFTLILEMCRHDFIILTTLLYNFFHKGCPRVFYSSQSEQLKFKVYRCLGKYHDANHG